MLEVGVECVDVSEDAVQAGDPVGVFVPVVIVGAEAGSEFGHVVGAHGGSVFTFHWEAVGVLDVEPFVRSLADLGEVFEAAVA